MDMTEDDTFKALQGYTYEEVTQKIEARAGQAAYMTRAIDYTVYLYVDKSLLNDSFTTEVEIVTKCGWKMSDYIREFFARKKIL
jgi:hypothetical protein